jgi:hypothetical protein
MSIRSLVALAVARDKAAPGMPAPGGAGQAAVAQVAGAGVQGAPPAVPAAAGGVPQQFVDVLTSAIPSEPLAAYTALVGIVVGVVDVMHPRNYLSFRWGAFAAFLVLTVLAIAVSYVRRARSDGVTEENKRTFPWAEAAAALIAGAAWGLVMPGSPLNVQLGGTVRTITAASITVGAAALLSLVFAPQLKAGTNTPGQVA